MSSVSRPPSAGQAPDPDADLNRALDEALEQIDRVDGREPSPFDGESDEARAAVMRQRRAGLRTVLSTLSTKVTAERSARSAEAAQAALAAVAAAREMGGDEHPEEQRGFSARAFRTGFLGGVGVLLAYITYLSLDGIRSTLIVIAVAALLAIGLDPAVGWMMRRGMRRGWAVLAVFLSMLAVITGAIYAIVPPIVTEVSTFVSSVPNLIKNLQSNPTIKNLDSQFHFLSSLQDSQSIQSLGSGAASTIVSAGVTVAGIAGDLFVVLILSVFMLAAFPKIKVGAFRLAPASRRPRVSELGEKILKQMGGYLAGATIVSLQAGLVAGVFAAIAGLPYPWAIALGAALLDFVPVVGPIIVGLSMALIGFSQSLTLGIIAAVFYLCQHLFEAYWLYPRVMRRQVDISTLAVVLAILVGGALLGVTGALLAVPVAAAVQLIFREVVIPMQERN